MRQGRVELVGGIQQGGPCRGHDGGHSAAARPPGGPTLTLEPGGAEGVRPPPWPSPSAPWVTAGCPFARAWQAPPRAHAAVQSVTRPGAHTHCPPSPRGRTPTALPRWPQFPAGLPLGASPAVPRTQRLGEAGRARKPAAGGERRGSPRPQAVLSLRFLDPRSPRCASLLGWLAPPEWQAERSVFNVFVMGLEMNSGWLVPSGALGSGRGAPPQAEARPSPAVGVPEGKRVFSGDRAPPGDGAGVTELGGGTAAEHSELYAADPEA